VKVAPSEVLKGGIGGQVMTVDVPGGTGSKGRFALAMTVPSAPMMNANEEVFLFLKEVKGGATAGSYSIMNFNQGKFSIGKTAAGEKVVTRDMTMAPLKKGVGMARGNRQVRSLDAFKEEVKSYLGSEK
jgi:hypothetical protein